MCDPQGVPDTKRPFLPQTTNGKSGPIKSIVNMGPVLPPQLKGKMSLYSRNHLVELQSKLMTSRDRVFLRGLGILGCLYNISPTQSSLTSLVMAPD